MEQIVWYSDDEIEIYFSAEPHIDVQYVKPDSTKDEKKEICTKPFILKNEVQVKLADLINQELYEFVIPEGYCWDGATIPKFFYRLVGANTDNKFLIASMIHDVLCENHEYVNNDRYFSTIIFERLLYVSGVGGFKRWMMKHSVDNFQKIAGGW